MDDEALKAALESYRNAWAALRMIREAVESFGPVASLESPEAVLRRGPEPVHEAEAIVEALGRVKVAYSRSGL